MDKPEIQQQFIDKFEITITTILTAATTLPLAKPVHEIVMPLMGNSPARIMLTYSPGWFWKKIVTNPQATTGNRMKSDTSAIPTALESLRINA